MHREKYNRKEGVDSRYQLGFNYTLLEYKPIIKNSTEIFYAFCHGCNIQIITYLLHHRKKYKWNIEFIISTSFNYMFIQQTINIEISTEIEHIKRFSKQVIVVLKTSEHSDINFIH